MAVVLNFLSLAEETKDGPPVFAEPLAEVEVTEGSAAQLQCRVTSQAEAAIEWFKDDEAIVPNERVKTRFDGELCTLRLMPSELDDEGEYKCVARNEFGSASCSAEVLVNEPNAKPEFMEKLKPVDVVEGDDAELRVCVTANPEPTVEWFRGSDKIEEDERHVMRGDPEEGVYTLTIKGVQPADAGSYKCVASNEEGKVSCKVAVAVKEKTVPTPVVSEAVESVPGTRCFFLLSTRQQTNKQTSIKVWTRSCDQSVCIFVVDSALYAQ